MQVKVILMYFDLCTHKDILSHYLLDAPWLLLNAINWDCHGIQRCLTECNDSLRNVD